ncbi:hypothetical protein SNEBB_003691 [Seison nebaliae]|nr:hypothetical protein SNEBB_003691 [Seison nebaliae]
MRVVDKRQMRIKRFIPLLASMIPSALGMFNSDNNKQMSTSEKDDEENRKINIIISPNMKRLRHDNPKLSSQPIPQTFDQSPQYSPSYYSPQQQQRQPNNYNNYY